MENKNKEHTKAEIPETVTSSTESFDSWTLVSDTPKQHQQQEQQEQENVHIESKSNEMNEPSGIEYVGNEEEPSKSIYKHVDDDLSDGISIISECESSGRTSPPLSIQQPHQRRKQENNEIENVSADENYEQPLTSSNIESDTATGSDYTKDKSSKFYGLVPSSPTAISRIEKTNVPAVRISAPIVVASQSSSGICSFFRLQISKIFIISSLILLFAFFGNIRNPGWQDWNLSTQVPQLSQRIENLELQNNLLRAEIDILSKNINSMKYNKEKFVKNNMGRDEIYNADKQQKKRRSGNDENINSDLYDNNQQRQSNEYNQKVNNEKIGPSRVPEPIVFKDEIIKNNNGEENRTEQTKPQENKKFNNELNKDHEQNRSNFERNKHDGKDFKPKDEDYKKRYDKGERNDFKNYHHDNSKEQNRFKNNHEKKGDYSKEKFDKKRREHNGKKNFQSDDDVDDDDDDDDSKEHHDHKKTKRPHHSGEHFDSKEKYNEKNRKDYDKNDKQHKKHYDSDNDNDDWHEKLMQHRENIRNDNNNWYLQRHKGREEARDADGKHKYKYKDND